MSTDQPGPICHRHEPISQHGLTQPYPAHTWGTGDPGTCLRCPDPIEPGDRYLCDEGGIIHVTCANTQAAPDLPTRRDIVELEELQGRLPRPTRALERESRHAASFIAAGGVTAGRPLWAGDVIVDLTGPVPEAIEAGEEWPVETTPWSQPRTVGEHIPAGALLEIRTDGRVYAAQIQPAEVDELAEQLEDTAATAAAVEQVDEALDDVAGQYPAPDLDFAEAIAGMANRLLQGAGLALEVVMACTGCGCSDNRSCDPPCYWVQGEPPRCSACGPVDQEGKS